MGGGGAPPPPDYGPIAAASSEQAKYSYEIAKEQLAWAKERYAEDAGIIRQVVDNALTTQRINMSTALRDRARYENIFQPLEADLARDAQSYASPERRELEAGRAESAVAQNFEGARLAAQQQLESYGVDPTSTRYAALDVGIRTQEAAAKAAARNQSNMAVDATGRALRSEAINVGRGYPAQISTQYAQTLQGGAGASGAQLAGTQSGATNMGNPTQWAGTGTNALGVWGNALSQGYNAQMQQYKANQESSSGFGSLLGFGTALLGFEEGGMVPPEASPSAGAVTDDVAATIEPTGRRAAINVGEFIVPKDVVSWLGEKGMQSIVEKARKEMTGGQAKPQAIPSGQTPEAPQTRATAIPLR